MVASVRAHANLNLFLAERAIDGWDTAALEPLWGEHSELLAVDTALFRLQLAYCSHLADLCEQKQLELRPRSAVEAQSLIAQRNELIPEILELVEREQAEGWLSRLLDEDFLPPVKAMKADGGVELIARSEDERGSLRNSQALRAIVAELRELFARHRETQQEY